MKKEKGIKEDSASTHASDILFYIFAIVFFFVKYLLAVVNC